MTNTASDLPRAARALLWAGDSDGVRSVLATLEGPERPRPGHRPPPAHHPGRPDGGSKATATRAAREYAAILPELAEMGLVYEQAQVVLDMALVLGPDAPVVQGSVDDARAILERLGARPSGDAPRGAAATARP